MSEKRSFLRLVPPDGPRGGDLVPGNGSNVLMPDGQKVPGVMKAEIKVEPGQPWTLHLVCLVEPHAYPDFISDEYAKPGDPRFNPED